MTILLLIVKIIGFIIFLFFSAYGYVSIKDWYFNKERVTNRILFKLAKHSPLPISKFSRFETSIITESASSYFPYFKLTRSQKGLEVTATDAGIFKLGRY